MNIHETVYLAQGARLTGDVTIGADSSVWYNAVIRADEDRVVIGERCSIQDGCILHQDPGFPVLLGDGVTVGHGAVLHGCVIGDYSLVGMGATVLSGAKIGKNVLIGAGALVTQNMEIPDGVMVLGCPAKVRRPLTEEELASLQESADCYVRLAQEARDRT